MTCDYAAAMAILFLWWLQHIHLILTSLLLGWPTVQFTSSSHQMESLSGVDQPLKIMDPYLPFHQILPWIVSHPKPPLGEIVKHRAIFYAMGFECFVFTIKYVNLYNLFLILLFFVDSKNFWGQCKLLVINIL